MGNELVVYTPNQAVRALKCGPGKAEDGEDDIIHIMCKTVLDNHSLVNGATLAIVAAVNAKREPSSASWKQLYHVTSAYELVTETGFEGCGIGERLA